MRKCASMEDVADVSGVSKATVSLVLRNKPGISAATRERVLATARELNYRLGPARRHSGRELFGQVGLLFVSPAPPLLNGQRGGSYLHHMLQGCLAETEHHNRSTALCQTCFADISAGRLPVLLQRQPVDGLMVRGWLLPELMRVLEQLSVPVVLMDCDQPASAWPHVRINNLQAMDELVAHLVAQGAKDFATITGDLEHVNAQERLAGLQMALRRRGLALPDANTIEERGFSEESGRRGVAKLFAVGGRFDTLVCQSDAIAAGAYDGLTAHGMKVPEQVRLTGFDNMEEFGDRYTVPLTTIDPQPYVIGQTGARLLGELLSDGKVRNVEVTVPCRLVVRQSA